MAWHDEHDEHGHHGLRPSSPESGRLGRGVRAAGVARGRPAGRRQPQCPTKTGLVMAAIGPGRPAVVEGWRTSPRM